jgi:hypothetical protein
MDDAVQRKFPWLRTAALVVIMIAIAGISYWLIPSSKSKPETTAQASCTAQSTSKKCHKTVSTSLPAKSSAKSASPSGSGSASSTKNTSTAQLNNTGPGNVIGLFIVASLIGGVSHYVYAKMRFRQSMEAKTIIRQSNTKN